MGKPVANLASITRGTSAFLTAKRNTPLAPKVGAFQAFFLLQLKSSNLENYFRLSFDGELKGQSLGCK